MVWIKIGEHAARPRDHQVLGLDVPGYAGGEVASARQIRRPRPVIMGVGGQYVSAALGEKALCPIARIASESAGE